jgi:hypothetical protein
VSRVRDLLFKSVPRQVALLAMVGSIVLAVTFTMYGPFSQRAHIRQAQEHSRKFQPLLSADRRFDHIKMGAGTGEGGCVLIVGTLSTNEDLAALKAIVNKSSPPVAVHWLVQSESVDPPDSAPVSQRQTASAPG